MFQGWLPPALDMAAAALLWVWFVNLYNFMDGIDGLAGSETAAIGIGLALFAVVGTGGDPALAAPAAAIAAAAIGFLVWNWAPARIFLGDVGSVPLGYLLGFLLLATAARGYWKFALILPLYFLADATITLLRRLARGERVWLPHREHFYQQAVQRGLGHAAVVRAGDRRECDPDRCRLGRRECLGRSRPRGCRCHRSALLARLAGSRRPPR